jgi:hypothetical protein
VVFIKSCPDRAIAEINQQRAMTIPQDPYVNSALVDK